jgi:hypothetical protein
MKRKRINLIATFDKRSFAPLQSYLNLNIIDDP